jgi:hypothetical protein
VSTTPKSKLIECREMLFAANQTLYVIGAALKDRKLAHMADAVTELASMLGDFSTSIDPLTDDRGEQ